MNERLQLLTPINILMLFIAEFNGAKLFNKLERAVQCTVQKLLWIETEKKNNVKKRLFTYEQNQQLRNSFC